MNVALIIAGGSGRRMNQEIPKQFTYIDNKPVIIHTLETFEQHPYIDEIGVVCVNGWQEMLKAFARQHKVSKLAWVVDGGDNGQASIRNGISECDKRYDSETVVLIHDAVRPLVTKDIISDCIVKCKSHGSGVSVIPETTVVLKKTDKDFSEEVVLRDDLMRTQTPQAFPLQKLTWAHDEALRRGITNATASCSMMIDLGEKVYFSIGSEENIKLTTQEDLRLFEAILQMRKQKY